MVYRILFIVDRLPFPPRDGVTIPTANYILGMQKRGHAVDTLVLKPTMYEASDASVGINLTGTGPIISIRQKRASWIRVIGDEIFGRRAFFSNFNLLDKAEELMDARYDVVWGSPLSVMYQLGLVIREHNITARCIVAGINDSYALVTREYRRHIFSTASSAKQRLFAFVQWLRHFRMEKLERELLQKTDIILVQTERDKEYIRRTMDNVKAQRVMTLPNGVRAELFDLPLLWTGGKFLIVAKLGGLYDNVLQWILKNVWPVIRKSVPEADMTVLGAGASESLQNQISDAGCRYQAFVEDLAGVYAAHSILLAPAHKNYGLINKVVEGMAAGLLIIGDVGSFNGIYDFKEGEHGFIAKDARHMAKLAIEAVNNPDGSLRIMANARSLVRSSFNWDERVDRVLEEIGKIV